MKKSTSPKASIRHLLFWLISNLPLAILRALGSFFGTLLCIFDNRNKRIAAINLSICFPGLNEKARHKLLCKSLKENARTLLETFWLWKHPEKALNNHLGDIKNEHLLKRAKNSMQGTIFITPHFGSWEFLGLLTARYCDLWILYAPSKSEYIDKLSRIGRTGSGAKVISTTELNLKDLMQHLKEGGCVGILPDQVPEGKGGEYVDFFQRKAYTSTLGCKLAAKLKCHVVLGYSLRNFKHPGLYDSYYFDAPKELFSANTTEAVSCMNQCIEEYILTSPESYIWGYKRFKKPAPGDINPYR